MQCHTKSNEMLTNNRTKQQILKSDPHTRKRLHEMERGDRHHNGHLLDELPSTIFSCKPALVRTTHQRRLPSEMAELAVDAAAFPGCVENGGQEKGGPENGGPENAGPTTGMENAGTNNYAEYNMYNHSQMLKAAFAG